MATLPFKEIGMNPAYGALIVETVHQTLEKYPNRPLSIQTISRKSGFPPIDVKNVLYMLLSRQMLKATFLPIHSRCDKAIGKQEQSAHTIYQKAERGEIEWCTYCQEPIRDSNDIQIQIIFWKPGTDARS